MDAIRITTPQGPLEADLTLPGSKSITNRALLVAALADGTSILRNVLLADDTRLMLDALAGLGVPVTLDESTRTAEITGCGGHLPATEATIQCQNAGTVMRFCAAMCALGHGTYSLDGSARMHERPIGPLVDALRSLGGAVEYGTREGFPPLTVHGRGLAGGELSIPAPPSSQFISALMMVAPYAREDLLLEIRGHLPSRPYIEMTDRLMESFGVAAILKSDDQATRIIVAAGQRYSSTTYDIEPDASNATYFLAAPAIAGGSVTVRGLSTQSIQGDVRFVDVLERMGCTVRREPGAITVAGPEAGGLRAIEVDLSQMPDTVQTLAVLALFAAGTTRITNVANLRIKETDRLAALAIELRKLGARIEEDPDALRITPPETLIPAEIETYDDHRMAMSFALAGLRLPALSIGDPQCCAKSFPDFFERFEAMLT